MYILLTLLGNSEVNKVTAVANTQATVKRFVLSVVLYVMQMKTALRVTLTGWST
jgi:hypothetical protein